MPIPSIFSHIRERGVMYVTAAWATGFSFLVILLPLYGITGSYFSSAGVILIAIITSAVFTVFLIRGEGRSAARRLFLYINSATVALVLVILAGYIPF